MKMYAVEILRPNGKSYAQRRWFTQWRGPNKTKSYDFTSTTGFPRLFTHDAPLQCIQKDLVYFGYQARVVTFTLTEEQS